MQYAVITTQFEGYHRWPSAPKEVDFLRDSHRHIFHVTVWIFQSHDDREVEYIMAKRLLNKTIDEMVKEYDLLSGLSSKSCEMMCSYIQTAFKKKYNRSGVQVQVLEDNENGALLK